jgi:nucleoside-diphosphate-sugar epimerase
VHGVSRNPAEDATDAGIAIHTADLLDGNVAAEIVRRVRPTHLVHAAWETTHPTYWTSISNLDWIKMTADLARAFAEQGGARFVQIGSCAEYEWGHGTYVEGVTPERPATRYGFAKLAACRAVEAAAHDNFEAVEARIFFVYGPRENPARLIPYACRSHIERRVPELTSGRQIRDLLFVEDAAAAILAVAESPLTGSVNVGGGAQVPLAEAASILARIAGSPDSGLGRCPDPAGDPELLIPDTRRLFETGWRPSTSLEQGLARTFEWWASQVSPPGA